MLVIYDCNGFYFFFHVIFIKCRQDNCTTIRHFNSTKKASRPG